MVHLYSINVLFVIVYNSIFQISLVVDIPIASLSLSLTHNYSQHRTDLVCWSYHCPDLALYLLCEPFLPYINPDIFCLCDS